MYERLHSVVALCASMPRTVEHLRAALGIGRTATYKHVARAIELGLASREAPLRRAPGLIVATRDGHSWSGSGLEVARIAPRLVAHWIACSGIALELAAEFPDARLLSAAELQLDESIEGKAIASAEIGTNPDGSPRLHRPDLVVVNGGRPIAVEVELTTKAPVRLEAILRGWRRAGCVAGVRYYTPFGRTRRAVERGIARTHAAERIELRELGCAT